MRFPWPLVFIRTCPPCCFTHTATDLTASSLSSGSPYPQKTISLYRKGSPIAPINSSTEGSWASRRLCPFTKSVVKRTQKTHLLVHLLVIFKYRLSLIL